MKNDSITALDLSRIFSGSKGSGCWSYFVSILPSPSGENIYNSRIKVVCTDSTYLITYSLSAAELVPTFCWALACRIILSGSYLGGIFTEWGLIWVPTPLLSRTAEVNDVVFWIYIDFVQYQNQILWN